MSMSEFYSIEKNNQGKEQRLKWNVARIAGQYKGFHLKEGMIYGIAAFHPKGEQRLNYLYVFTGETRQNAKTGAKYIRVFLRNNFDPESRFFEWRAEWLPVKKGSFCERLWWAAPEVHIKDYADYFPAPRRDNLRSMSYCPQGGKSIGAQFEYSGFGIKRPRKDKTDKRA